MSIDSLPAWFATPQGQYLLQWEQARFDALVADIFGYNALQVGLPEHEFLRASRMSFRFASAADGSGAKVLADPFALPFATGSLDLVLLPHVLEFSPHPHQVLREVERVLVPEGSVIISGFNPFSLWGLRRALARANSGFPWKGHYYSVLRIKDWLSLLGFETQAGGFGCYAPAFTNSKWIERSHFMDAAGDRWWPVCGGAYIIQGIKRVHGVRLLTPKWATERRFSTARRGRQVVGGAQKSK